jgi:hypothetical protein
VGKPQVGKKAWDRSLRRALAQRREREVMERLALWKGDRAEPSNHGGLGGANAVTVSSFGKGVDAKKMRAVEAVWASDAGGSSDADAAALAKVLEGQFAHSVSVGAAGPAAGFGRGGMQAVAAANAGFRGAVGARQRERADALLRLRAGHEADSLTDAAVHPLRLPARLLPYTAVSQRDVAERAEKIVELRHGVARLCTPSVIAAEPAAAAVVAPQMDVSAWLQGIKMPEHADNFREAGHATLGGLRDALCALPDEARRAELGRILSHGEPAARPPLHLLGLLKCVGLLLEDADTASAAAPPAPPSSPPAGSPAPDGTTNGLSLLHWAAALGDRSSVAVLLAAGAAVDLPAGAVRGSETALQIAEVSQPAQPFARKSLSYQT